MTRWPQRSYESAMELKGKMSARQAERETGIPSDTIYGWWHRGSVPGRRGKMPKRTHCFRGHPFTPDNICVNSSVGRRQCKECRRIAYNRWYWKNKAHKFHPVYNPDPELVNVEHLWFESERVVEYLLDQFTLGEIHSQMDSTMQRNLKRVRSTKWMRYVFADKLFTTLGLPLAMMPVEPVLGSYFPPDYTQSNQHG